MKKATLIALAAVIWLVSCKHEIINPGGISANPDSTGTGTNGSICFESDILPVFQSNCAKSGCHNSTSQEDGYVLDSYDNIIKRGLVKGNAASSKIYTVLFASGEKFMPRGGSPLSDLEKKRIAQWINEGAKNTTGCSTCNTSSFLFATDVQPILKDNCISCHNGVSASAYGNVDLRTYASVVKDSAKIRVSIQWLNSNANKNMPQGGPLPDCKKTIILNWLNAGGKNN